MSANFLTPKNWDSATDNGRNNIVFQNRNHDYGAYVIRRDYNHNLFIALFISMGVFLSAFIIPKILLSGTHHKDTIIPYTEQIIPIEIIPAEKLVEKVELPVSPPIKPIEKVATQNNIQPLVIDQKVEASILPNDQIINPGTVTTPGEVGLPVVDEPKVEVGIGNEIAPQEPVRFAEVMPVFPGGVDALFKYLQNNIRYPYAAKENGIEGNVVVSFVIDVTGKPVMLSIIQGVRGGKDLEAEAMRVISSMPHWSIGMQNNKAVPVQFCLPVKFDLN